VTEYINSGQNYQHIKKIYSVNIVYFDLGQGTDVVYHGKTEFRGIHDNDLLRLTPFQKQTFKVDEVYQLYPEYYILKVNDFNRWSKTPLDQWLYFLANSDIPEDADAPGLKAAKEKLQFIHMNREEQIAYDRYWMDRAILKNTMFTVRGEGLMEGQRLEKIQNARKMKELGVEVQVISQVTGLSSEEIEKL
jgi:predicted transposase/invertase (TIGR01784 family)